MQLGMIGLGREGASLLRLLMNDGHDGVVFDVTPASVRKITRDKMPGSKSNVDLVTKLARLRTVQAQGAFGVTSDLTHSEAIASTRRHVEKKSGEHKPFHAN